MKTSIGIIAATFLATSAFAQVNFDGTTYTQDFSTLSTATNTAQTWTNGETLTGWHTLFDSGSVTTYTPAWQSGISAGVQYHARNTEETNRSFFGARTTSGTGNAYMGLELENTTGSTLTSFDLNFIASQFYKTGVAQELQVSYSTNATSLTTGDWTTINDLTYTAPYTTGNALVSSTEEIDSRATLSITGQSVNWANGESLWLQWSSLRDLSGEYSGGAAVLAINDVSISAIPEPGTLALVGIALGTLLFCRRFRR